MLDNLDMLSLSFSHVALSVFNTGGAYFNRPFESFIFFHIYVHVPVVDLRAELSSASTRP